MIVASISRPGSIRESNQDHLLYDPVLGLLIVADGNGPEGLQAATAIVNEIHSRIGEIAPVTAASENEYRLGEAIAMARKSSRAGAANVSLAAAWVNRGILAAAAEGRCALTVSSSPEEIRRNLIFSEPVKVGQQYFICSEGFATTIKAGQIQLFADNVELSAALLQKKLEDFTDRLAEIYDGDDRSAIYFLLDKSDITAGEPHELELFEHCNRRFSIPIWAPVAAMAGAAISGIYTLFRLRRYLPQLIRLIGGK